MYLFAFGAPLKQKGKKCNVDNFQVQDEKKHNICGASELSLDF
jgi:hypothetical protein